MPLTRLTRRNALILTGSAVAANGLLTGPFLEGQTASAPEEIVLTDEPTRGAYGEYDVTNFGPASQRIVKRNFEFPKDVDVAAGYGIDVSHYTNHVPWPSLKAAGVSYVYIKASQSLNGKDDKFVQFWKSARDVSVPSGAYHFLTAGVSGRSQGQYFLRRLTEVGGLLPGDLQPVIDLEWDTFGSRFTMKKLGQSAGETAKYHDYWDDMSGIDIVGTVNDCVNAIRLGGANSAVSSSAIKPIIYTNRSWWETHVPRGTVFPNCTVWISDYREASYANSSPRSVQGHDYHLWQFTDKAQINVSGTLHGPYDSNKLLFGGIARLKIA